MTTLLETLNAWTAVNDSWNPGYAERKAEATTILLTEVEAMADAGEREAGRVWAALASERDYAARNAAAGDKMHSKVPEYGPAVYAAIARIEADAYTIQPSDDTRWCPECRRQRVVEEASNESAYHGHHEVGYYVERLMCGHQRESEGRIIGASPGGEAAAEAMAGDGTRRRLDRTSAAYDGPGW